MHVTRVWVWLIEQRDVPEPVIRQSVPCNCAAAAAAAAAASNAIFYFRRSPPL